MVNGACVVCGLSSSFCRCSEDAPDDAYEAKRKEIAERTIERLKRFTDDLKAGDLSAYKVTTLMIDVDGEVIRIVNPGPPCTDPGPARNEAYERLINQAAQLRLIADRAASCAIADMDAAATTMEEAQLIDRYLSQTNYMDAEDDGLTFYSGVIQPLLDINSGTIELTNYVAQAQRDLSRKARIKDELEQLKQLGAMWSDPVSSHPGAKSTFDAHPELRIAFDAARTALLFAQSDVADRALLMSLSPSVRLAQRLNEIHQAEMTQAKAASPGSQVDWSQMDDTLPREGCA